MKCKLELCCFTGNNNQINSIKHMNWRKFFEDSNFGEKRTLCMWLIGHKIIFSSCTYQALFHRSFFVSKLSSVLRKSYHAQWILNDYILYLSSRYDLKTQLSESMFIFWAESQFIHLENIFRNQFLVLKMSMGFFQFWEYFYNATNN